MDLNLLVSQSESVITQRLYRHLKRTPGTHKLGVLYVVDSVTRQWIEKARQAGQELSGSAAPEGTFASGVHKITELLPSLIDDLIQNAPSDHKVCHGMKLREPLAGLQRPASCSIALLLVINLSAYLHCEGQSREPCSNLGARWHLSCWYVGRYQEETRRASFSV